MDVNELAKDLTASYGDGRDGAGPTAEQWKRVLALPADQPITMVNFFKVRAEATYADGEAGVSGEEAFRRYSSVSIPAMERNGGRFLYVGPFGGAFVGGEEDWDLVAVGQYPDRAAFIAMQKDEAYRDCYYHRTAACERQKVVFCGQ